MQQRCQKRKGFKMKRMILIPAVILALLHSGQAVAQSDTKNPGTSGEETEMFVHPFLAHMGLPDAPDEVSVRLTGIKTRLERGNARKMYIAVKVKRRNVKQCEPILIIAKQFAASKCKTYITVQGNPSQ